ncbi:MAG: pectate lyase, partial [Promethearchaeota archaeon]
KLNSKNKSNKDNQRRNSLDIFKLRKSQSFFLIGIFICTGITGGLTFFIAPDCYLGEMGFSDPAYNLPSGAHYNTDLDSLTGNNQTILEALEKGLWAITKLRQQRGFPMWVETDGSKFYSDRGFGCPLFPGEFSIQEGTPLLGSLYLEMYKLENNSIYLNVAKEAADALIAVQDEIHGGFYYDGRRYPDGTGYQPHPKNWMRSSILDDAVTQSALELILDVYDVTKEQKYLDAFEKGFQGLCNIEKPQGGWPQRSNYPDYVYFSYVTLNDNALKDVIFLLYKANEIFPAETKYLNAAKRACSFLKDVQGNGGSSFQQGWAQQYNDNNQPAWARDFEPPGMCSFQTVSAMECLLEMYLITNDSSWLDPLPTAIDWLNSSETRTSWKENGATKNGWARLYELSTNRPIFGIVFGKGRLQPYIYNYEDARGGYGWVGGFGVEDFFDRYNLLISFNYNITKFREAEANATSLSTYFNSAWAAKQSQTTDGFWLSGEKIRAGPCASAIMAMIEYLKRV